MADETSSVALDFREFLRTKADEFGLRGRLQNRREWLTAIDYFFDQLTNWSLKADPERLLDIEDYKVTRTEGPLGTYDVRALRIRFGPGQVDLVPMSRFAAVHQMPVSISSVSEVFGRVDLTDGYRKVALFRISQQADQPWRFLNERGKVEDLTEETFLRVLQEYLS